MLCVTEYLTDWVKQSVHSFADWSLSHKTVHEWSAPLTLIDSVVSSDGSIGSWDSSSARACVYVYSTAYIHTMIECMADAWHKSNNKGIRWVGHNNIVWIHLRAL